MSKAGAIRIEYVAETTDEITQAVGALVEQLSAGSPAPQNDQLDSIIDSKCTSLFVARDQDSRIVGMLILAAYTTCTGMKVRIEDLVVDQKVRGRGTGEALCRRAIEEARELGAKTIELTSHPSRQTANLLYQKLGFERRRTNVYCLPL